MENFFVNLGLSYTWSKALPYLLMVVIGLLIGIYLFKRSKTKLTKLLSLVVIAVPFGIYFIFNPIYQGDFSNNSRTVNVSELTSELEKDKLYVISLPGCRFCKESIARLKEVKENNKNLNVEYVVTSSDSETLDFYQKEINDNFALRLAENPEAMVKLAQGSFPTFVIFDKTNNSYKVWDNSTFGVLALDEVVKKF